MAAMNSPEASRPAASLVLVPIMTFAFVAYLVIGIAIPVVPLYVRNDLGLSNFTVGLVAGSPFAAALLSRLVAGRFADTRGAKRAIDVGMLVAVAAGGLFLLSRRRRASDRIGFDFGSRPRVAWRCR
jgi:MFS family permease